MLAKSELARFLIGLVTANDADLIDEDSVLSPDICAAVDRDAVRQLRDMIQDLYRDFDYLDSPEFDALARDKSADYVNMLKRRWMEPKRRTEQRNNFADALAFVLSDDRVYELTPPDRHRILDEIRNGFAVVANPAG